MSRAVELSLIITCFFMSAAMVDATGVFSGITGGSTTNPDTPTITPVDIAKDGITDLDPGVKDPNSLSTSSDQSTQKSQTGILDILYSLAIPEPYLEKIWGVPIVVAFVVGGVFNLAESIFFIQFLRGLGFKMFN
jgi:hypothetical protein